MPVYRCQTVIHTADNVAANFATNVTYWDAADLTDLNEVALALEDAYEFWRLEMSGLVAQNGHEFKFYDMADVEPRVPTLELSWNFASAPSGAGLPPEVSLCVSFQGDKISGTPQARRRGRNYLPFVAAASNGTDARPDAGCIGNAFSWGNTLLEFSETAGQPNWMVYSELVEGNITPVTNGWVDNEWDTQRRRGREATARTVFPTP